MRFRFFVLVCWISSIRITPTAANATERSQSLFYGGPLIVFHVSPLYVKDVLLVAVNIASRFVIVERFVVGIAHSMSISPVELVKLPFVASALQSAVACVNNPHVPPFCIAVGKKKFAWIAQCIALSVVIKKDAIIAGKSSEPKERGKKMGAFFATHAGEKK